MMNEYDIFQTEKSKVMNEVYTALIKVIGFTKKFGTYDVKACKKASHKLQNIKFTYGSLLDLADYLCNISKYFTIKENKELIGNAGKKLYGFTRKYEMLLL